MTTDWGGFSWEMVVTSKYNRIKNTTYNLIIHYNFIIIYFKADYNEIRKYTKSLNWDSMNKLDNNIKSDSKSFYAYVGSKKRANNRVGPLRDNSKQLLNGNIENANLLNKYFSSVFTVENLNSVPTPIEMFSGNSDQTLANMR